ncbi:hypothetical protein [Actibacterium sp. 188UL27-1]|uniref:hypothetical protein n=1 Tax=Actibacterium sp. 188UL27-1 TaxID=2786961 RepID=UPI001959D1FB|nr:hypothetical protein [Actibacterium sp. 188UL27-1]MBM7069479.1 hypothetical protein [Actibacterium sp. 188UL27-1]
MRNWILGGFLMVLAACGTPQEQCIRRETRELRIVNSLIAEVQGNLTRGYAITREAFEVPVYRVCSVYKDKSGRVRQDFCWTRETQYRTKRVAFDPAAERRKLSGLQNRKHNLTRIATRAVAQCKAQFPED